MQLSKFRISAIVIGTFLLAGIIAPSAYSQESNNTNRSEGCGYWTTSQQGEQVWVRTNCPDNDYSSDY